MNNIETANRIAQDAGTKFVRSTSDSSWATKRAIPLWQATDIERRLIEAGIEASTAVDDEDREVAWVYASLDESADDYAASLPSALRWAATADVGEYLVEYSETGMTDAEDPGSRCGYGDDELDAIRRELGKRDLTLAADDRGLVAQAVR